MTANELPHDLTAEAATLGAILLDCRALDDLAAWLLAAHFYDPRHATIYGCMLDCHAAGTPPDVVILSSALQQQGQLDTIGGLVYLVGLTEAAPSSQYAAHYGRTVHDLAALRQLITVGGQIARLGVGGGALDEALGAAKRQIETLARAYATTSKYTPQALSQLLARPAMPIKWSVPDLLPEGLTLLCGKPKMKKSWLALSIGMAVASGGRVLGEIPVPAGDVLYLCLEDGERLLKGRANLVLGGQQGSQDRFFYCAAWPKLDEGGLTMMEQWAVAHPAARLIIVDTLHRIRPTPKNAMMAYSDDYAALESMKELADRHGLSVLVVHHLTKRDSSDDLDNVSGSTGLTGSCDGLLILKRERSSNDASLYVTGRDIEEKRSLALQWDAPTCQWIQLGDANSHRVGQERRAILDTLRESTGPMTPREVAAELDDSYKYPAIKQLMRTMYQEQQIDKDSRGRYSVRATDYIAADDPDYVNGGDLGDLVKNNEITGAEGSPAPQNGPGDLGDRGDLVFGPESPDHRDHPDHRITGEVKVIPVRLSVNDRLRRPK